MNAICLRLAAVRSTSASRDASSTRGTLIMIVLLPLLCCINAQAGFGPVTTDITGINPLSSPQVYQATRGGGDADGASEESLHSNPVRTLASSSSEAPGPLPAIHPIDIARVGHDNRYCVAFSPYPRGYGPMGMGLKEPSRQVVDDVMAAVTASGLVKCVVTYGARGANAYVPDAARKHGITVIQGIYLDNDATVNAEEASAASSLALSYPGTITALFCGDEMRMRHNDAGLAEREVAACIATLRRDGARQPIGHMASWPEWCNDDLTGPVMCGGSTRQGWDAMARQVDFIMLNAYAFFENRDNTSKIPCIQPADAAAAHVNRLTTVASMYPTMPVMLSESGWPGPPPAVAPTGWRDQKADRKCKGTDGAVTSRAIQSYVAAHTLKACRDYAAGGPLRCVLFEAMTSLWKFDTAWDKWGQWFGFCDPEHPYTCTLPRLDQA